MCTIVKIARFSVRLIESIARHSSPITKRTPTSHTITLIFIVGHEGARKFQAE